MSVAIHVLLVGAGYLQLPLLVLGTEGGQHFAGPSQLPGAELVFLYVFCSMEKRDHTKYMYIEESLSNVFARLFSKYFRGLLLSQIMDFSHLCL